MYKSQHQFGKTEHSRAVLFLTPVIGKSMPHHGSNFSLPCSHPLQLLVLSSIQLELYTALVMDSERLHYCRPTQASEAEFTTRWVFPPLQHLVFLFFYNIHGRKLEESICFHILHIAKYDEWLRYLSSHNSYQPFKVYGVLTFYLIPHQTILLKKTLSYGFQIIKLRKKLKYPKKMLVTVHRRFNWLPEF